MIEIILSVAALSATLALVYITRRNNKTTREQDVIFHNRLKTLEDRFFYPSNYHECFIRPVAKKKEESK